jgi:hypothetical protein
MNCTKIEVTIEEPCGGFARTIRAQFVASSEFSVGKYMRDIYATLLGNGRLSFVSTSEPIHGIEIDAHGIPNKIIATTNQIDAGEDKQTVFADMLKYKEKTTKQRN